MFMDPRMDPVGSHMPAILTRFAACEAPALDPSTRSRYTWSAERSTAFSPACWSQEPAARKLPQLEKRTTLMRLRTLTFKPFGPLNSLI